MPPSRNLVRHSHRAGPCQQVLGFVDHEIVEQRGNPKVRIGQALFELFGQVVVPDTARDASLGMVTPVISAMIRMALPAIRFGGAGDPTLNLLSHPVADKLVEADQARRAALSRRRDARPPSQSASSRFRPRR